ncbi:RHS repeat domain-containing protein [Faucicola mancuniensis]|uniref:RHS repeat domain-containing protein n=1 Tax=Faucicola mancuniensis TaxID=1309795 RepID=UPI003977625D
MPNPVKFNITKQPTQTATTTYQYDGVGQLIKTTLPDGQVISYQYDDAHRMIGMTDSLGNRISYTLNGAGDIIETKNTTPKGHLRTVTNKATTP